MALVIAGERSGVGKTTVTLALLAYLCRLHRSANTVGQAGGQSCVQSFKVGPDYIDPMFHSYVTGRPCRNLDPVLTSETYVQSCFARHSQGVSYSLVEGVMGLFDGAAGDQDVASTAHVARLLNLPVLLVLDCSRLSRSVAAIAHGYRSFDPRLQVAGVVLNRVGSDRHLDLLKAALAPLAIPILGILRRQDDITLPDRHLGLVPTDELTTLKSRLDRLADLGRTCFDWSQLLPLLDTGAIHASPKIVLPPAPSAPPLRIAVARDRAFSFYYADNLDLLAHLGAELVPWSPLADRALPESIQGLYFGGGFPEMFAATLADNQAARQAVHRAIRSNMPTYAECGGLMYLSQQILDFNQQPWDMVGILPTQTQMEPRLTLGYRHATALQDGPLLPSGARVWGHEFHRSGLTTHPPMPLYQLRGYTPTSPVVSEGWRSHQVHASYLHLHWGERPDIPTRFLTTCRRYGRSRSLG